MDVRIGVVWTAKELNLEMDGKVDDFVAELQRQLAEDAPMVWLVDRRGHRVAIPRDKLAYIEVEGDETSKKVGFGA